MGGHPGEGYSLQQRGNGGGYPLSPASLSRVYPPPQRAFTPIGVPSGSTGGLVLVWAGSQCRWSQGCKERTRTQGPMAPLKGGGANTVARGSW